MKTLNLLLLLFLGGYPLPPWKVFDLAIHRLPHARRVYASFTAKIPNSAGEISASACTFFAQQKERRGTFKCTGKKAVTVSFPESFTFYPASCTELFVAFLTVISIVEEPEQMEGFFTSAGVDLAVSGVARWEDDIAVVFGAEGEGEPAPQVWFHQERYFPTYFSAPAGKEMCAVVISRYSPLWGKRMFPSELSLYAGRRLLLRLIR